MCSYVTLVRQPPFAVFYTLKYIVYKTIPVQVWAGPEVSRSLKLLDFKIVGIWRLSALRTGCLHLSPIHPPRGNIPSTYFCCSLNRSQGHSATGRIMSLKNSNDTIGSQLHYATACPIHCIFVHIYIYIYIYRIFSRNLRTFFPILAAENRGA